MKNTSIGGKIVLEYLAGQFRNLPSRTLAAKIYNENKEAFKDAQSVDNIIRYYRGRNGDRNRKSIDTTKYQWDYNPYKLPESDETEHFAFHYPEQANKVLMLYDVHVPYHSKSGLTAALEYGYKNNINSIFIGGDFLDCHKASSKYQPDPRKRDIKGELEMGFDILQIIRKAFPDAFMFYLKGNHEERLETYLMVKAPELFNLEVFKLEELLHFDLLKIQAQTCSKQTVKIGGLNAIHGHELGQSAMSPVNIARGLFMRTKTSTICGHHHQVSEHTETDLNGKLTTCWSVGTLGELHPAYLPNNKWAHGFAVCEWDNEEFSVRNLRVLNGKVL